MDTIKKKPPYWLIGLGLGAFGLVVVAVAAVSSSSQGLQPPPQPPPPQPPQPQQPGPAQGQQGPAAGAASGGQAAPGQTQAQGITQAQLTQAEQAAAAAQAQKDQQVVDQQTAAANTLLQQQKTQDQAKANAQLLTIEQIYNLADEIVDITQPGVKQSVDLIVKLLQQNPAGVVKVVNDFTANLKAYVSGKQAAGQIAAADGQKALGMLNDLSTANQAVSAAVQAATTVASVAGDSIPGVGQIVQGCMKIIGWFVDAAAERAADGIPGGFFQPVIAEGTTYFNGWRSAAYWYWNIPVLSLTAPVFASQFLSRGFASSWQPSTNALVSLCQTYPFGCPVPQVAINTDGSFTYTFAASDGSQRTFAVYTVADVTASGPRGFDISHPSWWKFAWGKQNVVDVPVPFKRQVGPLLAIGLTNVQTLTAAQAAAIPTSTVAPNITAQENPPPTQFAGYYARVSAGGNAYTYYYVATGPAKAGSAPAATSPGAQQQRAAPRTAPPASTAPTAAARPAAIPPVATRPAAAAQPAALVSKVEGVASAAGKLKTLGVDAASLAKAVASKAPSA